MTMLDYYQILQVEPGANASEIREAYYDQIQRSDTQRGKDIDTAVHMQQGSEAYTILGNPYQRASYDLERLQGAAEAAGEAASLSAQSASLLPWARARPRIQCYLMAGILLLGAGAILSAVAQGLYWLPVLLIVMLCVAMNLLAILLTRHSDAGDIASVSDEKNHQLQT